MASAERRIFWLGIVVMVLLTIAGVDATLAPALWARALGTGAVLLCGWGFFLARSLSRQRLAATCLVDPLTGLYNRRYLVDRLAEELVRASRYGGRLVLAVIDLDDFKQINDRFGHLHGDRVLRAAGLAMRTCLRPSDVAFRFGGEEFVVLLPYADPSTARDLLLRVAEHLRPVTFSGGLAEHPIEGGSPERLLGVADRRLVAAKAAGKARILGPDAAGAV